MNVGKLARLTLQSVRRNRRDFLFSSIGIIVGIGTLLFFTALGSGIKTLVLERIFVVTQLEVVQKTYDMGGLRTGGLFGAKKLDDAMVERLRQIDGVKDVYPKMKFTFPARAQGGKSLLGKDMYAELIADGIPPQLVEGELGDDLGFEDWGAERSCTADADCPDGHACDGGTCAALSCQPGKRSDTGDDATCTGHAYCNSDTRTCALPIPAIVSPMLLEIYNSSIHTALGGSRGALSKLPKLSEEALVGFEFEAVFGESFLGRSVQGRSQTHRVRLVGFSDKAINLGATIPIGYVKRFNAEFVGPESAEEYHSIVVEAVSNDAVARVAHTLTEEMGLALSDRYAHAQRAGLLIMLITLVFNLIALIILAISAVNIMHTFLMVITERRRELGLMRALGATRGQIRLLVFGEATVLGLFGGAAGALLGFVATRAVDLAFHRYVGDFPFKPESLFIVEPWFIAVAVAVAWVFCWIGALLPAYRASRIDPAAALSGR